MSPLQEISLNQRRQDAHTFRGFEEQRRRGSSGRGEILKHNGFIRHLFTENIFNLLLYYLQGFEDALRLLC